MNSAKIVGTFIVALLVLFIWRVLYLTTPVWTIIQTSPWWVYVLIVAIIGSGYLSYKYAREEKEMDDRWIEQEGELFMEPIRKRRQGIE